MQRIGYHIFASNCADDVFESFYDKLEDFHKLYVNKLLIYSAISIDSNLKVSESVKISDHIDYDFVDLLNKQLKDAKPIIEVEHIISGDLDCSINFFYVTGGDVEGFYISEITTDMDDPTRTHYQLFNLKDANVFDLNNHWHTFFEDI
jgi:hypothetical protein